MKDNMKDNQNTDKIDMSEINLRYKEKEEEEISDKKEIVSGKTKKKKFNAVPLMSVLVIILTAFIIVLAYITISNNKSLNSKINELINATETTETETQTEKELENQSDDESEERTGKLIQDLNFRSGPGYEYDVIGTIPAGTEVTGHKDRGWLKIEYNGQTGYIGPQYLE